MKQFLLEVLQLVCKILRKK